MCYYAIPLKGFSHFSSHSRLSLESQFSIATFRRGNVYRAAGWQGDRAGEPASFLYTVDAPEGKFTQAIAVPEIRMAYEALIWTGVFTRRQLAGCSSVADTQQHTFAIIGGLFQFLGEAIWGGPCVYWRVALPVWIGS